MKKNRQKEIIQILEHEKVVSAASLAERFDVSIATIRRDFSHLEKRGLVKKTYGGAEIVEQNFNNPSLNIRRNTSQEAKASIAVAALQYIQNGFTIALDSGSTVSELCHLLPAKDNLIIICSDTHNANLALSSGNRVYMMGGFLTPDGTCTGAFASEFLSNIGGVDLFISSSDGADPEEGLTTNEVGINELKRLYLKWAKKTLMLVDHSKFNQKGFNKTCDFSDIDVVIVDEKTAPNIIERIRSKGTKVIVAGR